MEFDRLAGLYIAVFLTLFATAATALSGFYIVSGFTALASVIIFRETVRTGNKKGLDRDLKVLLPLQRNMLFLGLVSLTSFISTVPAYLAISTLFSFSLLMSTHSSIRNRLNRTYEMTFGDIEIGLAAGITLLLSGVNAYFGFYGTLMIAGLSVYQLGELLVRSLGIRSRI